MWDWQPSAGYRDVDGGAGRRMLVAKLVREYEQAWLIRQRARELQDRALAASEHVDFDQVIRTGETLSRSGRASPDGRFRRRTG